MKNEELLLLRGGSEVEDNCVIRNCSADSCSKTAGSCTKCAPHPNQHYDICIAP